MQGQHYAVAAGPPVGFGAGPAGVTLTNFGSPNATNPPMQPAGDDLEPSGLYSAPPEDLSHTPGLLPRIQDVLFVPALSLFAPRVELLVL